MSGRILAFQIRRSTVKLLACSLLFFFIATSPASAQTDPRSPGVRQGEQATAQAEKDIPPPIQPHPHLDLAKLRQDADDLARIAQTIPLDVMSIQRGLLPKDMIDKLRQIEKLSKHLRDQIKP
jgi:hypothetical protein